MITKYFFSRFDKLSAWFIIIMSAIAIFVPLSNLMLPASSPLHVPTYAVALIGKYLCYALLAISVDLLWGYTGLLSLGQALFFSLGGYMLGMHLMRMIGDLGQHKKPIPDFLVFLGWTELPAFWKPFASFPFALTMAFLVPGLIAYVFGRLAFRSRIKGVYFSILTQALTYAASIMFFRNNLLLDVQTEVSRAVHASWVGRRVPVLVEEIREHGAAAPAERRAFEQPQCQRDQRQDGEEPQR